jgi:Fibronectin type III domain
MFKKQLARMAPTPAIAGSGPLQTIRKSDRAGTFRRQFLSALAAASFSTAPFANAQAQLEPIPVVSIRLTNNVVSLEWRGGFPPYRVQQRANLTAAWQDIPISIPGNTFNISMNSSSMFFRVQSSADWSPPSVPSNVAGHRVACDQAVILWGPSYAEPADLGIRAYNIYRDGQRIAEVLAPALSFTDAGLNVQSNYSYSVSALDQAGNESARSVPSQVTTFGDCTNPGGQNITLAWDPSGDPAIAGYVLYYGTASRNYTTSNNVWNSSSATVRNLQSGATYFFAVTAFNTFGLESDFSGEVSYIAP